MIIGPDFIWLHFPKCAGTSVEKALSALYAGHPGYRFDYVGPDAPMIWHDTIQMRLERDPSFEPGKRKVIACFRRLPSWILSRVHYEAARPPHHEATRDMIVSGRFYEQSGFVNHADYYASIYDTPSVDFWIRTEHAAEDLARVLGLPTRAIAQLMPHDNRTQHSDQLTDCEIKKLYDACPKWTELEERIYRRI